MSEIPDVHDSASTQMAHGIYLLDRTTGEVRAAGEAFGGANWWWWAHGNGACDCNRASVFDSELDLPCSEWRFVVVHPDGVPRAGFNDYYDLTGLPAERD